MKKHITKLCGIILVCLLVAGALPFGVYAADYEITLNNAEESDCTVNILLPDMPLKADVVFAFDLTADDALISAMKTNVSDIIQQLNALSGDIHFGVITYMDYTDYYSSYDYEYQYSDGTSDYPYRMDCALTGDTEVVSSKIDSLARGDGGDGGDVPASVTRMFYESYADDEIGWRDGSSKILVHFGASVPHDDNINEGLGGDVYSTGGDPGPDAVMFTDDDLDFQTVLAGMAENNIHLLNCLSHGTDNEFWVNWVHWTDLAGGKCFGFQEYGDALPAQVVGEITSILGTPTVEGLTLVAEKAEFEPWIAKVSQPYTGPFGEEVPLIVTFKRPDDIPAGTYTFNMNAVDADDVQYGSYEFVLTCNDIIEMYTIVFDANGGTGGDTIDVAQGETPVPPDVAKEGFEFIRWEPAVVPAAGDTTYTAQWKAVVPKTWKITFDAAGGTGSGTIEVADGAMPVPPTVMKEGYDFAGWKPEVVPAAGDATYTAQWQETAPAVTWQITFDAAGGTGSGTIEVADGETPVPPAVEKEGFDFIGWEPSLVPAGADATYTAQWKAVVPKTWQITFDTDGGTGSGTIEVADGVMPMPPLTTKEGFIFTGWKPEVVPAAADATYVAQWEKTAPGVTWQITYDANGGTGGKTIEVAHGAMPIPPVVTKEGFVFAGWEPALSPATTNASYKAKWTAVDGETTTNAPEEPSNDQTEVPATGSAFKGAAVFAVLTLAAAAAYVTNKKKHTAK